MPGGVMDATESQKDFVRRVKYITKIRVSNPSIM